LFPELYASAIIGDASNDCKVEGDGIIVNKSSHSC
jgi:hypothetical protein